uniref:Ovule protein n=1 Tax=Heterorhabditis bacteriophora TaxID=37862 RepID=A0A1I7WVA2_HETBA
MQNCYFLCYNYMHTKSSFAIRFITSLIKCFTSVLLRVPGVVKIESNRSPLSTEISQPLIFVS